MQVTLSKRKRDNENRVYAVWSPVASGKTMLAVNLAAVLSEQASTAIVDLAPDNAVYTWTNCPGTKGLQDLLAGNRQSAYTPLNMPGLQVYTAPPGEKPLYNGEASLLSNISKALDGHQIVFDTPGDFIKAANILTLVDVVILVTDYNIHSTMVLQNYLKVIRHKLLVVNRFSEEYTSAADPVELMQIEPATLIPDIPKEVYESILTGIPLAYGKHRNQFEALAAAIRGVESIAK